MNKYIAILLLAFITFSSAINAAEYFLEFEQECSTSGNTLDFKCVKSTEERVVIFFQNKKWYGKNPESGTVWELDVVKADQYILVLNNPVFFSGTSVIHILKATGKFYMSEFAYSSFLEENEATVRYGSIRKVNK